MPLKIENFRIPSINIQEIKFSRKNQFSVQINQALNKAGKKDLMKQIKSNRKYKKFRKLNFDKNTLSIEYGKRMGVSKVRLFREFLRTLQYITQSIIYYNPLKLFIL